MRLGIELIVDKLKVDFKKALELSDYQEIEYEPGSELKPSTLIDSLINSRYQEYDDIDGNTKCIISIMDNIPFKGLNISFKASTYTAIGIEFSDGSSLYLNGENGDYQKYSYSFNELNKKIKYKNRQVSKIVALGSLGAEELPIITISYNK